MTKDKLKELFAVECTETDGKGVTVIKGTPMDIINWINDKLDQETQRLKAELAEKDKEIEAITTKSNWQTENNGKLHSDIENLQSQLAEKDNLIHSLEQQLEERNIGIQALEQHKETVNRMAARMQEIDKEHQSELTEVKEKHKRDVEGAWKAAKKDVYEYTVGESTKTITAEQYYNETHKTK